ncbi:3-hydroxy-3-methylglutaryl coenzyme A reductase [Pelomyxa schiedti]|nr:3-hydroxy-3-methylglutaryl coenzyme A reductase [Pelomyxa schiedti]
MPSLEVGVVGGGTQLAAQSGCLELLGVMKGKTGYAERSRALARLICASVLAGELSLIAALTSGDLVKSHLRLNRHKP